MSLFILIISLFCFAYSETSLRPELTPDKPPSDEVDLSQYKGVELLKPKTETVDPCTVASILALATLGSRNSSYGSTINEACKHMQTQQPDIYIKEQQDFTKENHL